MILKMKNRNYLSFCLLLSFLSNFALAEVKLPAIISDNMVLQQNTTIALWGWADAGESVEIKNSWNNKTEKVKADDKGSWMVHLKTTKAGGPYSITFTGENKIELHNVLLGEVWLCSGQSNMEFPLKKHRGWQTGVINAEQEISQASYPMMRMFIVEKNTSTTPLSDVKGAWNICSPQTAGNFSAVAYYFGKRIQRETGFPVGLIHSSWGGTPAESWTKREVLESDKDFASILNRYDSSLKKYPGNLKEYEQELREWKNDSAKLQDGTRRKPVKPLFPEKNSKSPMVLYNAMIHPLISFTLKGVIWYQGESNAGRAYQYRKLFPALIKSWRSDWKQNLPFYFVQIAPHSQQNPEIREAQMLTFKAVPNTGMAVITDWGDSVDIHPRNKEVAGERLALWALAKNYGKKAIAYSGPLYQSMKIEGSKIILHFNFTDGGLKAKEGELKEFTIAGDNQKFVPAHALIKGNTVVVWSDEISHPVAVRFAWKNFMHPNFFNGKGLPASPFRTDSWPGETFGKN
jgi:sialate O-acetylesterase